MDVSYEDDDDLDKEESKPQKKLSKKQRKQKKLCRVAQLKALVKRPDLVEVIFQISTQSFLQLWDVTSHDPVLLVYLKGMKNTVGIPRHWCQKRKFLQNKRGVLKKPFALPDYIEATGIAKMRDPFNDK